MGSGRTNLLLRHDKIREGRQEELGWEDHTNTHINTHTRTKMMDLIGRVFHSAFSLPHFPAFSPLFSAALSETEISASTPALNKHFHLDDSTHTHTHTLFVCESTLVRYKRSAVLTQSTTSQ